MMDSARDLRASPQGAGNTGYAEPVPLDIKISKTTPNEDGSIAYSFDIDEHVKTLIANMRALWRRKELTDVMLISEDKKTYRYHSVMLAACSSIFRELLSGTQMQFFRGTLAPHDVSSKMLEVLQDYVYRPDSFTQFQGDNESLYGFAHYFGIEELAVNGIMDTERFLEHLGNLYSSRRLTFGVLSADDVQFPCHSAIIAAAVPGLRPLLTKPEVGQDQLENLYSPLSIDDATSECLKALLDYIYYGEILIHGEMVVDLLKTATKLRVLSVAKACCEFIKSTVNVSSVLIYRACVMDALESGGDDFCTELKNELEKYIVDNFHLVIHEEAFNLIESENDVISFLAKADLSGITLPELIDVFSGWCFHNDDRKTCLPGLMALVALLKAPQGILRAITQAAKDSKSQTLGIITTAFKGTTGTPKSAEKREPTPNPVQEAPDSNPSQQVPQHASSQQQFNRKMWETMLGPDSTLSPEQQQQVRAKWMQHQQQQQQQQQQQRHNQQQQSSQSAPGQNK